MHNAWLSQAGRLGTAVAPLLTDFISTWFFESRMNACKMNVTKAKQEIWGFKPGHMDESKREQMEQEVIVEMTLRRIHHRGLLLSSIRGASHPASHYTRVTRLMSEEI